MNKIIAVDFDGTLCEDKWPEIGEPNPYVINYILEEKENGARIILWTCRSGRDLDAALRWCKEMGIVFDAVNANLPEVLDELAVGDSRKIFAHEYIDDRNNTRFNLPYIYPGRKNCNSQTRLVRRVKK